MQAPEIPEDDVARVATLNSLRVLDTPRDDRFDRYTRISARIFDAPIALISLVDRYRQWFKSAEGLSQDETPRDISFCGHAILGDDIFEVPDARRDPRFRDNPLVVSEPNVRFYAGAPLQAPNGHKLGTLCIIDKVPRRLSDSEKTMLKNLADMVVGEMVNYLDTQTGLSNRNELMVCGAKCFSTPQQVRRISLLLFDVNDVAAAVNDAHAMSTPGEEFARLIQEYFPDVLAKAHLGGNQFCVLVDDGADFDQTLAINRLCESTRQLLCPGDDAVTGKTFVGRIPFNPDKHVSFDDMLRDADALFFRRDRQPETKEKRQLGQSVTDALSSWRKTTF